MKDHDSQVSTYIINLDRREDRFEQSVLEMRKAGIDHWRKFSAKDTLDNPAMGCSLSHAHCLSTFLFESHTPFLLVLEDDFEFTNAENFLPSLTGILDVSANWEVALLSHNQAVPIEQTPREGLFRVINSQTASAYLIHRAYVPKMIEVFYLSAESLRRYSGLPEPNRSIAKHNHSLDILWHFMQSSSRFVAPFPALVRQRESYSDIERRTVNYGV